jgi:small-conductance mechanosensitive channel
MKLFVRYLRYFRYLRVRLLLRQVARILAIALTVFALSLIFTSSVGTISAIAQDESPSEAIVLDGRRLFAVSQSGKYSAEERAEDANRVLRQTVKSSDPPIQVTIENNQDLPVIQVDGNHLLTVTQEDAPLGRTVEEQAGIWAGRLKQAIQSAQRQRSPEYIRRAIFISLGYVFLAAIVTWGLGWVWHHWLQPWIPTEVRDSQDRRWRFSAQMGAKIFLGAIRVAVWLFTIRYILDLFPQTRELSRQIAHTVVSSLVSDLVTLGETSYSVVDLLILIVLFAGLIFVSGTAKKVLRSRVLQLTGLSRGSQETIAQIATYGLTFFGTIVLLQLWGLDLSSLTIFAGVLGVGIGLGLQGIAKEFVSGLVIIFERPIQVGDFINVGDLMGTVERISVRSTEIRTLDDVSIIVPNSRFLESEVINWTHNSPVSRLVIPVGVAYGSNLSTVRGALIDAAKEHPDVLPDPSPKVFFKGFGDSSLDFNLLIWTPEPRKQFRIKSDLYFRIEAILRHRGVEIPFPQRDLHVRSGNLPIDISPQLSESLLQLSRSLSLWLEHQSNAANGDGRAGNGVEEQGSRGAGE